MWKVVLPLGVANNARQPIELYSDRISARYYLGKCILCKEVAVSFSKSRAHERRDRENWQGFKLRVGASVYRGEPTFQSRPRDDMRQRLTEQQHRRKAQPAPEPSSD